MKTLILCRQRILIAFLGLATLALTCVPTVSAQVTNGLVGYWKFDTGNGIDSSGNNLTAFPSNGPVAIASKTGGGLYFDGVDDCLVVTNYPLLNVTTGITVSLWFNAATWNPANVHRLFGRINSGNQHMYNLFIYNGTLKFELQAGFGGNRPVTAAMPSSNQWHHVAVTWSTSDNNLRMFTNGVLANTFVGAVGTIETNNKPLYFAKKEEGNEFFNGALDDVRLYNRALTTSEIQQLAHSISGTISYSGKQPGNIYVLAATNLSSWSTQYATQISSPTNYYLFAAAGYTNWLRAFRDLNGNKTNDAFEAQGQYISNPVTNTAGAIENINVTLTELDTDTDGLPDWWEWQYFGNITNATPTTDAEPDQLTNLQEYQSGSNPLLADTDSDGLPDWWEVQYGLNAVVGNENVGDGRDGDLSIITGQTYFTDNVRANVIGTNVAGLNRILVSSTNGFLADDCVLILATQDPNTISNQNIAGIYEFARVASISNTVLFLNRPLSNTFAVSNSAKIQILRLPQYNKLTVDGMLTCQSWNGNNGGVLAFLAKQLIVGSAGQIQADGKGFQGGPNYAQANVDGYQGESFAGAWPLRGVANNYGGGGGGGYHPIASGNGGGGAGHGGLGENGSYFIANPAGGTSQSGGAGGLLYGVTSLSKIFLGSGGGSGGQDGNDAGDGNALGGQGGAGGGLVFIFTADVENLGLISASGQSGADGTSDSRGGGGGGSGGTLWLASGLYSGSGTLRAVGGSGGGISTTIYGGTGAVGRLRIDLPVGYYPPTAVPSPGFLGNVTDLYQAFGLNEYSDSDSDGLDDLQEYTVGTNPLNTDTDGDGLPDKWEADNGTQPTLADANIDVDGDGLSNGLEFKIGTKATNTDSDEDGIADGVEYYTYGSNPILGDTDGDGMADKWEIENYLNPLINDAAEDRDLDGASNLVEFNNRTNGYFANRADSLNDGKSDFERLFGKKPVKHYYDKNDRLIGSEFNHGSAGLSLAYVYDGNGNILNQAYLSRDANTNGLPDLYEFLNGLTNSASAYNDSDGDGWTDYQEWIAGSNAGNSSSIPDVLGVLGTNLVSMAWPFTPSNFVMAVGQLDGTGPEEIVIGADGDPGTTTNFFLLLSQSASGWTTQRVNVGSVGITSLAVGQASSNLPPAVYFGSRVASGTGTVWQVTVSNSVWTLTNLSLGSTGTVAMVLGIRSNVDLLATLSAGDALPHTMFGVQAVSNSWTKIVFRTSGQALGGTTYQRSEPSLAVGASRLLASGGIEVYEPGISSAVAVYRFENGGLDGSGNNHHLALVNVNSVPGKFGQGISFGGVATSYAIANPFTGFPTNEIAVSAWVNVSGSKASYFFSIAEGVSDNDFSIGNPPGLMFHINEGDGGSNFSSPVAVNDGAWHHVAVTWRSIDGELRIYKDGNLAAPSTLSAGVNLNAISSLVLGQDQDSVGGGFIDSQAFNGILDDVVIFNRVLSPAEVQMIQANTGALGYTQTLIEPLATNRLVWKNQPLCSGTLRAGFTNSTAIVYGFVDDKNGSSTVDAGDDFVVTEYLLSSGVTNLTSSHISLDKSPTGLGYGLACVAYQGGTNRLLFTAEPNGSVYSWVVSGPTSPLQRQLFSAHRAGKIWHQLGGHKGLIAGEALTGLWVDPTNPAVCNLTYFAPATKLYAQPAFPQNAPVATILPSPNSGQGIAAVDIRLWDAEGNISLPQLQVSMNSGVNWSNATIASLDGGALGYATAAPAGTIHHVLWNAAADVRAGYTNTVLLRVRAGDNFGIGNWSPTVSYSLAISVGNPIAFNDAVATLEDVPRNIAVLANDHVEGGQTLSVTNLAQPLHGTASITTSNTMFYTPATNFSGADSFTYTAIDTAGGTSVASVSITVIPVNDPPVAAPYTFSTTEDFPLSLRWNPARDAEGDIVALQSTGPTSANGGAVSVLDGVLTYQPPLNFNGSDTFNYTLIDNGQTAGTNQFQSAIGSVTVNVSAVNDPPVVSVPGQQVTAEDTVLIFSTTNAIMVTDPDAASGLMEVSLSAAQGHITLSTTNGLVFSTGTNGGKSFVFGCTLTAANTALTNLIYRPDTNYHGADLLNIAANDQGNSGAGGAMTDAKAVAISVTSINDPPIVFLTSPTNNAEFIAPAVVTLQASATGVDGQIVRVEFFAGTNKLGEKTNEPYTLTWSNVGIGSYQLSALAIDTLGSTNLSPTVTINSLAPGFVQLTSPQMASGGVFNLIVVGTAGEVYNIEASTNMATWQVVGIVTNQTGTVQFQETVPPGDAKRYYRAMLVR